MPLATYFDVRSDQPTFKRNCRSARFATDGRFNLGAKKAVRILLLISLRVGNQLDVVEHREVQTDDHRTNHRAHEHRQQGLE